MSDRMILVVIIAILVSVAGAALEPFIPPPANPGVYHGTEPANGVLPFQ